MEGLERQEYPFPEQLRQEREKGTREGERRRVIIQGRVQKRSKKPAEVEHEYKIRIEPKSGCDDDDGVQLQRINCLLGTAETDGPKGV